MAELEQPPRPAAERTKPLTQKCGPRETSNTIPFAVCPKTTAWRVREFHSAIGQALKANQRKMTKRRHGTMLNQTHAAVVCGPIGKTAKSKLRPPPQSSRNRSEAKFKYAARTVLSTDVIDEHDLATGSGHANEFVERGLRLRHCSDDELS